MSDVKMFSLTKTVKPDLFGINDDGNLILRQKNMSGFQMNRMISGRFFKQITSAQVLALNATPITVIAAAPAGFAWVVQRVAVHKPAGTAYAGIAAGEDLVLKYTNGSGVQVSSVIETTGFLDQATVQTRYAMAPATTGSTAGDITPVAAAAVVMHLLVGEITTGTSVLNVEVIADLLQVAFTK